MRRPRKLWRWGRWFWTDRLRRRGSDNDPAAAPGGGRTGSVGGVAVSEQQQPGRGREFTLSVTVRNDGAGDAPATTLRYYRSTDATITTSDTLVVTDAVAGLAASANRSKSAQLIASSIPETYYYGGCVDPVTGESHTANNCSASVRVDVSDPGIGTGWSGDAAAAGAGPPDLVVGTLTVSDASVETGGSFTLSATVRNAGDGESPATTLRYYSLRDLTTTTPLNEVGTDDVGALTASGTSEESISLTARRSPGKYFYGACVDAVAGESDTTNNCSAPVTVTVDEPQQPEGLPSVQLDRVSSEVTEGMPARFTVTATLPPTSDLVVYLYYVEYTLTGTQTIYHIWPPVETTVTITAGSSSTTLTTGTIDDSDADGNSVIQAWVASGNGYTVDRPNHIAFGGCRG